LHWKDQIVNLVKGKIAVGGRIHKKQYVKYAGKMQSFGVTDGALATTYALTLGSPTRCSPGCIMPPAAAF
jgi:hypothetical protein